MKSILISSLLIIGSVYSLNSSAIKINTDSGYCNNPADAAIFQKEYSTFHAILQYCAENCYGSGICTNKCLVKKIGISSACSKCFGDDVNCTEAHCIADCLMTPSSSACLNCNKQNCTPALETCSARGIPTPP